MTTKWLALLVIGGLATWRLSHMLVEEDGPFLIFFHLRDKTGIRYALDPDEDKLIVTNYPTWNPLYCILCTSIWVAPVVYGLWIVAGWLVAIIALSGIACLIEAWHGKS